MNHTSIDQQVRQNKAFRERVSYWRKKGLSPEQALQRAGMKPAWPESGNLAEARKPGLVLVPDVTGCQSAAPHENRPLADSPSAASAGNLPFSIPSENLLQKTPAPPSTNSPAENLLPVAAVETWPGIDPDKQESRLGSAAIRVLVCSVVVLGASSLLIRKRSAAPISTSGKIIG